MKELHCKREIGFKCGTLVLQTKTKLGLSDFGEGIGGLMMYSSCELLLSEAVSWVRCRFANPEKE
jgi:hypothetical protein